MSNAERLALIQGVMPALNPHYRDAIRETFAKYEIQGNDWFLAYLAHGVAPEPLRAATMHRLTPYVNVARHYERLNDAVERGVLTKVGDDAYLATEKGLERPVAAQQVDGVVENAQRLTRQTRRVIGFGCRFGRRREIADRLT